MWQKVELREDQYGDKDHSKNVFFTVIIKFYLWKNSMSDFYYTQSFIFMAYVCTLWTMSQRCKIKLDFDYRNKEICYGRKYCFYNLSLKLKSQNRSLRGHDASHILRHYCIVTKIRLIFMSDMLSKSNIKLTFIVYFQHQIN